MYFYNHLPLISLWKLYSPPVSFTSSYLLVHPPDHHTHPPDDPTQLNGLAMLARPQLTNPSSRNFEYLWKFTQTYQKMYQIAAAWPASTAIHHFPFGTSCGRDDAIQSSCSFGKHAAQLCLFLSLPLTCELNHLILKILVLVQSLRCLLLIEHQIISLQIFYSTLVSFTPTCESSHPVSDRAVLPSIPFPLEYHTEGTMLSDQTTPILQSL